MKILHWDASCSTRTDRQVEDNSRFSQFWKRTENKTILYACQQFSPKFLYEFQYYFTLAIHNHNFQRQFFLTDKLKYLFYYKTNMNFLKCRTFHISHQKSVICLNRELNWYLRLSMESVQLIVKVCRKTYLLIPWSRVLLEQLTSKLCR